MKIFLFCEWLLRNICKPTLSLNLKPNWLGEDVDSSMTITADIVEAFLKCPTKCYLRSLGEVGTGNAFAEWVRTQNELWRREGIKRLMAGTAPGECVGSPSVTTNLNTAKWRLAIECLVRSRNMESDLHAVERIPSEGRGKPPQFIPIRFVSTNKLNRDDKLLLAFDALLALSVFGWRPRIDLFRTAANRFLRAGRKNRHCSAPRCKMRSFKTAASMILRRKAAGYGRNQTPKTGGRKGHSFGSYKKSRTPRPERP